MISFASGSFRFDLRAAAIIRREDELLIHRLEGDAVWALPGGRVEIGETAAQALVRELHEELGEQSRCGRLLCIAENFFNIAGRHHHEVGMYFETELLQGSRALGHQASFWGHEATRQLEFRWVPLAELNRVKLRPSFLVDALSGDKIPLHIVHRDTHASSPLL